MSIFAAEFVLYYVELGENRLFDFCKVSYVGRIYEFVILVDYRRFYGGRTDVYA